MKETRSSVLGKSQMRQSNSFQQGHTEIRSARASLTSAIVAVWGFMKLAVS